MTINWYSLQIKLLSSARQQIHEIRSHDENNNANLSIITSETTTKAVTEKRDEDFPQIISDSSFEFNKGKINSKKYFLFTLKINA